MVSTHEVELRQAACRLVNTMPDAILSSSDKEITLRDGFGLDVRVNPVLMDYVQSHGLVLEEFFLGLHVMLFSVSGDAGVVLEGLGCRQVVGGEADGMWEYRL